MLNEHEELNTDEDLYNFDRERLFPSPQQLFVGIPQRQLLHQRPTPSSCNPIGHIYFIAHTIRTLASGNIRWWVIAAAGLFFGSRLLLILWVIIIVAKPLWVLLISLELLMELLFHVVTVVSVWKGSKSKICDRKIRR